MKLTAGKCFVAYWVIALLTFGYVSTDPRFACGKGALAPEGGMSCAVILGATLAAPVWPVFWTWEGFSIGRQALKGGDHG